jgi:ATP-dependent RNA helicase RhlE
VQRLRESAPEKVSSLTTFDDFTLNSAITCALAEEKYLTPTPIQAETIPAVMSGRDVVGIAQTGTGKTAAFALPILHQLATSPRSPLRKSCRILALSPTRELSSQILDSFRAYGRHLRVKAALAIGGVSMGAQVRGLLNGVDVLVATPGRLLDLVKSNALRLGDVECFVLDEADRMLDMGFIHDIRKIVASLPAERQTLMFSATMPQAIAELATDLLRNPIKVAVAPAASTAERVEQRIIRVDRPAKLAMLVDVLRQETIDRALIFTRTKHGADKVARALVRAHIDATAIHGNKSQNQRERVLAAFRKGDVSVLVATDIAARGIDVDGISHVVNFDLPNVPETYVHRIGRTARAGAEGVAISLCDGEELAFLRDIEKLIRLSIPVSDRRNDQRRTGPPPRKRTSLQPVDTKERHPHRSDPARTQSRHSQSNDALHDMGSVRFMHSKKHDHGAAVPRAHSVGLVLHKEHNLTKEELLQFEGLVTEILLDGRYRVQLGNDHQLVAYTAGRMRRNRIKTLAGDRVTVEVSPYDLEKGRLVFRHKEERAAAVARLPQRNQFRRR